MAHVLLYLFLEGSVCLFCFFFLEEENMKLRHVVGAMALCFFVFASTGVFAQDNAGTTYDVVVTKVRLASKFLEENGAAGLAEFNDPEGPWVWADTYVFVYDCGKDLVVAHPASERIGDKISERADVNGYHFALDLCDVANNKFGGWVEYYRPSDSADSSNSNTAYRRKITYIYKVPGTPYSVGAGIYDSELSLEELNEKVEAFSY